MGASVRLGGVFRAFPHHDFKFPQAVALGQGALQEVCIWRGSAGRPHPHVLLTDGFACCLQFIFVFFERSIVYPFFF